MTIVIITLIVIKVGMGREYQGWVGLGREQLQGGEERTEEVERKILLPFSWHHNLYHGPAASLLLGARDLQRARRLLWRQVPRPELSSTQVRKLNHWLLFPKNLFFTSSKSNLTSWLTCFIDQTSSLQNGNSLAWALATPSCLNKGLTKHPKMLILPNMPAFLTERFELKAPQQQTSGLGCF